MRAITVAEHGGPEVLTWSTIEDPEPGPSEVVIDVVAAGVNRADLMQRQGRYPPPPGASPIIGLECSGRVSALGAEVDPAQWRLGQECVGLLAGGGYAERVAIPAEQVLPPPPEVDLVTAAGVVEVAATVVSNLDLAGLRSGGRFLVHGGSGGIGSFAIQYAKQLGATVLTTAGTVEKLAYCRELGADHVLDYHDDWATAVADTTNGEGVDVILDNMGAKYLEPNLACLAPDGRLMIIGLQGGRTGSINLAALMSRRGAVFATGLRGRPIDQKGAICRRLAEAVWPLIGSGAIRPARQSTFWMAEAADAHRQLETGANVGKIILMTDAAQAHTG